MIKTFRKSVNDELTGNIVPFWTSRVIDFKNGGFIGRMKNDLTIESGAPKGLILNARLLWTYAALYRHNNRENILKLAYRAFEYIMQNFKDRENNGFYWMLKKNGTPRDTKKKIYGQAFVVYALAEFFLATGEAIMKEKAIELFNLIEEKSRDPEYGGYFEAYERDWILATDLRLGEADQSEKKSMNTHLHILEAYTNLYRIWPDAELKIRIRELIDIFLSKIIDRKTLQFQLFFDEDWRVKSDITSYGHDIEGSWLIDEAAVAIGEEAAVHNIVCGMADRALAEGVDEDGGLFYEGRQGHIIDTDKHWWPQAEAAVGFLNAFSISGEERFLHAAFKSWQFIREYISDKKHGEWFWKVDRKRIPDAAEYKVSEWKSPYHNTRACLELLSRLNKL
ncbi:AGE family epimerase/isomerase [candidate division KSB1 bacterium]|nr:AGE family epimerase/isomerase [candidate division KSB1 bacterium]